MSEGHAATRRLLQGLADSSNDGAGGGTPEEHLGWVEGFVDSSDMLATARYAQRLEETVELLLRSLGTSLDDTGRRWLEMDEQRLKRVHASMPMWDVVQAVRWIWEDET